MQQFDPNPVEFYRRKMVRRRTKLMFIAYGLLGLTLAVFL